MNLRLLFVVFAVTAAVFAPSAHGEPQRARCELPSPGGEFATAAPEQADLDPDAVRAAIDYAAGHMRTSVQVFRGNCLVGRGPLDAVTGTLPTPMWSSTKSVISILTGIALGEGKLGLDDPIDAYLPAGPRWGDAAHRALTLRNLLTQTSGLAESILAEFATTGIDPNIAQEALAQPLVHPPGTYFQYSQRTPDLLAFVVQRAVGEDLQDYAQRTLFDPLGIPRSSYTWLRDRAGNTYGYAHLFLPPVHYAKLGLLLGNDGAWRGRQLIPAAYVHELGAPTAANGCYGFLFWTNRAAPCTAGDQTVPRTIDQRMIRSAPPDLYAMIGAFQQSNFVIPSLDMTVTWTGFGGDANPFGGSHAAASDLFHDFFRILLRGVRDQQVPDPGPYEAPPLALNPDLRDNLDPDILRRDLTPNPQCTVIACAPTP
ncbi:CubicO group peptidase (beta-lactamase class C family) [Nocardia transvalensis]|uniref:CubicO group peptidase (Beta-lactamase class C family) n=1 Tax=Nocardia transvalensis TaxID=37333 RepID=A0A7W9UHD5_9NOCA|nr:serine hydrolase [Nocardia transvalensis]MBB5913007.1 CubicO group peptidase (beta-lactamase class C family) [Nocardia transvalensis]